jgi:hypothetical protein
LRRVKSGSWREDFIERRERRGRGAVEAYDIAKKMERSREKRELMVVVAERDEKKNWECKG